AMVVMIASGSMLRAADTAGAHRDGLPPRPIVVISDLHFGVGKIPRTDRWDPSEDFRWSHALATFLRHRSDWGQDRVDLVIAGDRLELWQPRRSELCASVGAALGCTPTQMERLTRVVVDAHRADLAALGTFARQGSNRLRVIPGNHDAALMVPGVWRIVADAL